MDLSFLGFPSLFKLTDIVLADINKLNEGLKNPTTHQLVCYQIFQKFLRSVCTGKSLTTLKQYF